MNRPPPVPIAPVIISEAPGVLPAHPLGPRLPEPRSPGIRRPGRSPARGRKAREGRAGRGGSEAAACSPAGPRGPPAPARPRCGTGAAGAGRSGRGAGARGGADPSYWWEEPGRRSRAGDGGANGAVDSPPGAGLAVRPPREDAARARAAEPRPAPPLARRRPALRPALAGPAVSSGGGPAPHLRAAPCAAALAPEFGPRQRPGCTEPALRPPADGSAPPPPPPLPLTRLGSWPRGLPVPDLQRRRGNSPPLAPDSLI